MNFGPIIFLAAFFAMTLSWVGMVLQPQLQLGSLQHTNSLGGNLTYPVRRTGLAQEGLEVYRANGCVHCHTKQIGQSATALEVLLTAPGTNPPALVAALRKIKPDLSEEDAAEFSSGLPKQVVTFNSRQKADDAIKTLGNATAKAQLNIVPTGPEIARGWGKRRSVAEDYLYDSPVLLGYQRIGPDLSNVGLRQPDMGWHLRHLYAPRSEVEGSTMPPHEFLFVTRRIGRAPSADALQLKGKYAPPQGYEVVPRRDAVALAAYLISLRADAPLYSAPRSVPAPPPSADTNAPAGSTNAASGGGTNATPPGTNAPAS